MSNEKQVRLTPEAAEEIRRLANARLERDTPKQTPCDPLFMLRALADLAGLTFSGESAAFIRLEGPAFVVTSKWHIEGATPLGPNLGSVSTNGEKENLD